MAKLRTNVKSIVEKLQRSLLLGNSKNFGKPATSSYEDFEDYTVDSKNVPEDIKAGHFAVIAVHGNKPQRFVLPLSCLSHPRFIMLLEQAAEEFGFVHEGALAIPCRPAELEKILAEHINNNRQRQADSCGRGARRDSADVGHSRGWFM